jgi:hypothetical protein
MKAPVIRDTIAVLGAASCATEEQVTVGFRVGREIARLGFNLITGMTLGVPYAAAIGAKSKGAVVVGVSPAASREEHIERYRRPLDCIDTAIYTGMGFEGRQPVLVRSAKGAVFVGGEFGTLAEFSAAWTAGNNVLGVLEGAGGISDFLSEIIAHTESDYGSVVIYDSRPEELVRSVCREVEARGGLQQQINLSHGYGSSVRSTIEAYLQSEAIKQKVESFA